MARKGFSLVELMVVLSMVSILAAIGMTHFSEHKKRGYNVRAQSDLKHLALGEEAYFNDYQTYKACNNTTECAALIPGVSTFSPNVTLSVTLNGEGFIGTASHPEGDVEYTWNSSQGGLQ